MCENSDFLYPKVSITANTAAYLAAMAAAATRIGDDRE
jgi:hypothetical protein